MKIPAIYTDRLLYFTVRSVFEILKAVPHPLRVAVIAATIRVITLFIPSYRRVSHINLKLAFPDKHRKWRNEIISKNFWTLGVTISDFIRMPRLSRQWFLDQIEFPYLDRYREIKRGNPAKGLLVATGHLGSFELMAFNMSRLGYPLSFVVRNFKVPPLDHWWNSVRELYGNRVISRKGAYRQVVRDINRGRDVGILFDQNIKRSHAVFVDWFGRRAATAKSLALAALETEALVVVCALQVVSLKRYRMNVVECDFSEIYQDKKLSRQEKVIRITEVVSQHYQDMIKGYPEGWFWMHRRWKTTERPDQPEDLY